MYGDIYYSPENYDLTIVGELSADLDYEFDMLVVWQHKDGRVFYASDSGCSCPSPFEDYNSLESLTLLDGAGWTEFQTAVEDHDSYGRGGDLSADKTQLLAKVSALVPRA